jgi:hypothetical protein
MEMSCWNEWSGDILRYKVLLLGLWGSSLWSVIAAMPCTCVEFNQYRNYLECNSRCVSKIDLTVSY